MHVIVNEGKEAGASLPHTHAQLYALPFVPAAVARERERFTAYSRPHPGPQPARGPASRRRCAGASGSWRSTTRPWRSRPFAARVPFHLQMVPRTPAARFSDDGPLGGRLLHEVLNRLRAALGTLPPLNMWVRTAPRDAGDFCWRIEIMPRLAQLAGLEIGTGVHLNVLAPEDAAQRLRDANV